MKKVFFMSTHAAQGTGYGRVSNILTNRLCTNFETIFYGFQNYKGQDIQDRFIDPRITFYDAVEIDPGADKGFGDAGIVPAFDKEKPDILFIYNDINVCKSVLNLIDDNAEHKKFKVVLYLDIVYPWENTTTLQYLGKRSDKIFVFLEYWKTHLAELGIMSQVMPHGVDLIEPRERSNDLFDKDDFVVLNLNRNSYRKQLQTTIKAFLLFIKKFPGRNKKLFLSCILSNDDGYDIRLCLKTECMRLRLNYDQVSKFNVFINPAPTCMTEEKVHQLYNDSDVGLNTACGEGFGLTTSEHASCGKPQIVSGVPALKETLGDVALVVEPSYSTYVSSHEKHGGEIYFVDAQKVADAIEMVYLKKHTGGQRYIDAIKSKYNWEESLKILDTIIAV